ncbi:MAG: hypothetical protein IJL66_01240 [Lachnospiraceae bacterium]|nr:hypothetical protein [Lachnospiraceae bacterium]
MKNLRWMLLGIAVFCAVTAFWTALYAGSALVWALFVIGAGLVLYGFAASFLEDRRRAEDSGADNRAGKNGEDTKDAEKR